MTRVRMKELARSCVERLTPSRMTVVATGKDRQGRGVDVVAFPGVEFRPGPAPIYARVQEQTPEPYPLFKRDRFGKVTVVGLATPTAPLRRIR